MYALSSLIMITLGVSQIENNRMLSTNYGQLEPKLDSGEQSSDESYDASAYKKLLPLADLERSELDYDDDFVEENNKQCAIIVVSNGQSKGMQSLLRKYKYDADGVLIPSSVKYFIKMSQGYKSSPLLVPVNDKAFSPQGGFVRYYKEVPPIPRAW